MIWELLYKRYNNTLGGWWRRECCELMSDWRDWTRQGDRIQDKTSFFRVRCTFHIHSPLLTFFLCFTVLFQSCCSHVQVFGKTLVHEFPIFYSHTEWNLLSSCTNTLLWCRDCFKKNYTSNKYIRSVMDFQTDCCELLTWQSWLDKTK